MKKEHLEKLRETIFIEPAYTLYIMNQITDLEIVSDGLVRKEEIDIRVNNIYDILDELTEISEKKDRLINMVINDEEEKNNQFNFKKRL